MSTLRIVVSAWLLCSIAGACSFRSEPAGQLRYYRAEGWSLPGVLTGNLSAPNTDTGIPGLSVRTITIAAPFVAGFPETLFDADGKRLRMPSQQMLVNRSAILRWEIGGKAIAYTYSFTPVTAHWDGHEWKIDQEAGCEFSATFVDDKGDGLFRLLVPDVINSVVIANLATVR